MEDQEIVRLFWARREQAIQETDLKYGKFCSGIALRILKDRQDAEECVDDVYLAAWKKIPPAKPDCLPAFLGRITRNIALDCYDKKRAKKREHGTMVLLSELEECIPSGMMPEEEADANQTARWISSFLSEQTAEKRCMFLRRYWYGDSIAELAERFDSSEERVKSVLFRLRKSLKKYLEKEGVAI